MLSACTTPEDVEDRLASAKTDGFDIVLIDTPVLPQDTQRIALLHSDLILSPVIGPFDAMSVNEGIGKYSSEHDNVLGLLTGNRNGGADLSETHAALAGVPMLQTVLPWYQTISDQARHGDIAHFATSLTCHPHDPGYARFRAAQAAWSTVLALTVEVQWALDGLRLEQHVFD